MAKNRGKEGLFDAAQILMRNLSKQNKKRRLHITNDPELCLESFMDMEQTVANEFCDKPKGLWYGIDDSWMDWCSSEMPHWLGPYVYELILDEDRVLTVPDLAAFEKFEDDYGYVPKKDILEGFAFPQDGLFKHRRKYDLRINYQKIATEYDAWEITPYLYERRLESMWYYGWDCASGIVWNKAAIKDIRLFAAYDEGKDVFRRVLQSRKRKV